MGARGINCDELKSRATLAEIDNLIGRVSPAEAMMLLEKKAQLQDRLVFLMPGAVEPELPSRAPEAWQPRYEVQDAVRRVNVMLLGM